MQSKSTSHISLIRWTALALLTLCFAQTPVRAQNGTGTFQKISFYNIVLGRGQTLRYTWANLNDPDPQKREFEPTRIQVKLFGANGSVIAQAGAPAVEAGKFQFFDFNRNQINLPGEPGTGRLQCRLAVTVHYQGTSVLEFAVENFPNNALHTAEVFDTLTGQTTVSFSGGVNAMILNDSSGNEYLNPQGFQIISAGSDHLIGIVPGQTLLINLFNPPSSGSGVGLQPTPTRGHIKVFSHSNILLAQSAELVIPPGEFRSVALNHAAFHLPGEPGTGRLQVRVCLEVSVAEPYHFTGDPKASSLLMPSLETVDNNTGRTRQIYNPYITMDFVDTGTGRSAGRVNNLKQIGLAIHSHNDSGH